MRPERPYDPSLRLMRPDIAIDACVVCGNTSSPLYGRVYHPVTDEPALACSPGCALTFEQDHAPTTQEEIPMHDVPSERPAGCYRVGAPFTDREGVERFPLMGPNGKPTGVDLTDHDACVREASALNAQRLMRWPHTAPKLVDDPALDDDRHFGGAAA